MDNVKYNIQLVTGKEISIVLAESEVDDFVAWLSEEIGADIVSFGDGFLNRKYIVSVIPERAATDQKELTEVEEEDLNKVASSLFNKILKQGE